MTHTPIHASLIAFVTALSFAGFSPAALSVDDDDPMKTQDGAKAPPPTAPNGKRPKRDAGTDNGGVLAGPKVPDGASNGDGSFGGQDGKKGNRGGMQGNPMAEVRLFMGALASIDSQLNDEQRTQIQTIRTEVEGKMKAWKEANGEKLRVMEEQMRGARGKGKDGASGATPGGPPSGPPAGPPAGPPTDAPGTPANGGKPDQAAMQEMQKLRESMPKMEEARTAIMAILTPDQQTALKSSMVGLRKEMEKRGGEGGKRKGGKGGAGAPDSDGMPAKAPPPQDPPKGDYKFPG